MTGQSRKPCRERVADAFHGDPVETGLWGFHGEGACAAEDGDERQPEREVDQLALRLGDLAGVVAAGKVGTRWGGHLRLVRGDFDLLTGGPGGFEVAWAAVFLHETDVFDQQVLDDAGEFVNEFVRACGDRFPAIGQELAQFVQASGPCRLPAVVVGAKALELRAVLVGGDRVGQLALQPAIALGARPNALPGLFPLGERLPVGEVVGVGLLALQGLLALGLGGAFEFAGQSGLVEIEPRDELVAGLGLRAAEGAQALRDLLLELGLAFLGRRVAGDAAAVRHHARQGEADGLVHGREVRDECGVLEALDGAVRLLAGDLGALVGEPRGPAPLVEVLEGFFEASGVVEVGVQQFLLGLQLGHQALCAGFATQRPAQSVVGCVHAGVDVAGPAVGLLEPAFEIGEARGVFGREAHCAQQMALGVGVPEGAGPVLVEKDHVVQYEQHVDEAGQTREFRESGLERGLPGVLAAREGDGRAVDGQCLEHEVVQASGDGQDAVADPCRQVHRGVRSAVGDAVLEQFAVRSVEADRVLGKRHAERFARTLAGQVVAPCEGAEDHGEEGGLAEAVDAGHDREAFAEGPPEAAAGRVAGKHFVVVDPQVGEDGKPHHVNG